MSQTMHVHRVAQLLVVQTALRAGILPLGVVMHLSPCRSHLTDVAPGVSARAVEVTGFWPVEDMTHVLPLKVIL